AKRLARGVDPSKVNLDRQVHMIEEELNRLWNERRPMIVRQLSKGSGVDAVSQARADLISLKAQEKTLDELLARSEDDLLQQLAEKERALGGRHGGEHPSVVEVRAKIARVEGRRGRDAQAGDGNGKGSENLLDVIEQSLHSFEAMRAEFDRRFDADLKDA